MADYLLSTAHVQTVRFHAKVHPTFVSDAIVADVHTTIAWLQHHADSALRTLGARLHAQRFLSAYGPIAQHFRPRRHLLSASKYREEMRSRFESWAEMTGTKRAA